MIEVRGLTKAFGLRPVLRGLDLAVKQGEFVAVVGPNGAGKTTLLRILGVVSHQPLLYGELTAQENLRFYGRMYGVADLEARIIEVLALVGLSSRRHDLIRKYSRGMQQRLAIGRGILHDPELLLFDEPYTGLDPEAAEVLDRLLTQVSSEGRTVLMTSHDLVRAAKLASRVDILFGGVIARSVRKGELPAADLANAYRQVTHA